MMFVCTLFVFVAMTNSVMATTDRAEALRRWQAETETLRWRCGTINAQIRSHPDLKNLVLTSGMTVNQAIAVCWEHRVDPTKAFKGLLYDIMAGSTAADKMMT